MSYLLHEVIFYIYIAKVPWCPTTRGYKFRLMFVIHAWISVYIVATMWLHVAGKSKQSNLQHVRSCIIFTFVPLCGLYFQSRGFASVVYKPSIIQTHTLNLTYQHTHAQVNTHLFDSDWSRSCQERMNSFSHLYGFKRIWLMLHNDVLGPAFCVQNQ